MDHETLLFRCDANAVMGAGHVMRCLALAQAWADAGGRPVFAATEIPAGLKDRLRYENVSLTSIDQVRGSRDDAQTTIQNAKGARANWVVVDGDQFDSDFLRTLRAAGLRVFLIDDFACRESFPADLIMNSNLGVTEEAYRSAGADVPLFLGESYILLRREFLSRGKERSFPEFGARVLVSLGGSDPENLAPRIAEALGKVDSLQITVVAGAACEHWFELKRSAGSKVRAVFNHPHMRELMEQADLAITAAGGTLWELLYMGCAVLSYARNPVQARVVNLLAEQGAVRSMGDTRHFDGLALAAAFAEVAASKALREQMANSGRRRIDGNGASRLVAAIQTYENRAR